MNSLTPHRFIQELLDTEQELWPLARQLDAHNYSTTIKAIHQALKEPTLSPNQKKRIAVVQLYLQGGLFNKAAFDRAVTSISSRPF